MKPLQPVELSGRHVRLVPLTDDHGPALQDAARDGELWRLWYTNIPSPDEMADEIADRLEQQRLRTMLPFTVIDPIAGTAAGMTSFTNIDLVNDRVEIGYTWYAALVQQTLLNTECKLLMLAHAFETLGCIAVEFRTHFLNRQSRQAIERLGAKLDGVLRNHRYAKDGTIRDTCVYSIIAGEWPVIKTHLSWLLTKPRKTAVIR